MITHGQLHQADTVNFFISYTGSDVEWAKWIAWELERAGFTYRLQAEHFPPGTRFINQMRVWLQNADHVLAIISPAYFESPFASLEMQSAIAEEPFGEARRVIPVIVEKCSIPTLFKDLVYIDFVGKSQEEQQHALIAGLRAAMVGTSARHREIKKRPAWPGMGKPKPVPSRIVTTEEQKGDFPIRVQFNACDVGRGLDLKGEFDTINAVIKRSSFSKKIRLHPDFDVTDTNLFEKLNTYRPHVVHIAGNQNGGDVLLPSGGGGEVVVPDVALAGLLSSLGTRLRLAIIDTCKSYRCARRVSEVVDCAVGVNDDIFDQEATRFYEVFYEAMGAGHSIADAHGQATAALQFKHVPRRRIPRLCVKAGKDASQLFLVR
jgi:TIR domain